MIPVIFTNRVMKRPFITLFVKITGWLSSFIWSKHRLKLKMATLQLHGSVGGLDLPNVRTYQLCTHMCYINDLVANNPYSVWLGIETCLSKYPLRDLLFFKKLNLLLKL